MVITTTDIQNNFGKYLKLSEYEDVIITKNGKKAACLSAYRPDDDSGVINESTPEYVHAGIRITYEEFLKINEESEKRYEYIDGELYILSSPSYPHQRAVSLILIEFASWFRNKKCEALTSPFDVTLYKSKDNICVVQPDILVICDHENIDGKGRYKGTPSLAVEVLSESTRSKDVVKKLDLYMKSGVREYWIVNTASREIYIYAFKDSSIETIFTFKYGETAKSCIFEGLKVELRQIFT